MATEFKIVSIATGTGTTQIDTAHGMGATPQLAILRHGGLSGTDARMGFGAFTSSTERAGFTVFLNDAVTTSDTGSLLIADGCLPLLSASGTLDGQLDAVGFDATNVSVIPDNAFAGSNNVSCFLMAGLDAVKVGTFTLGAGTGSQSFTPLSFQPDWMWFFGVSGVAAGTIAAHGRWAEGWSTVTANRCIAFNSRDARPDSQTDGLISDDYAWAALATTTGAVSDGFIVTSFNADGWTLNKLVGGNTPIIGYIAGKGCSAAIIDTAFRTDTNNITVTGASFTPKAVCQMVRPLATASEEGTSTTGLTAGFGWATGATTRYSAWIGENDAEPTTDVYASQSTTLFASTFDMPTGATTQGSQELVSFDSGGVTLDQVAAGVVASYEPLLLLGDAAAATGQPTRKRSGGVPGMNGGPSLFGPRIW